MQKEGLVFTGMELDRAGALRKSDDWFHEQLKRGETRLLPTWQGRFAFAEHQLLEVSRSEPLAERLLEQGAEPVLLGLDGEDAVFVVDCSALSKEDAKDLVGEKNKLIPLRHSLPQLPRAQAAMLSYASSLAHWHREHQFCGRCGQKSESHESGHMRRCTDEACGAESFPRTNPVVIMLVEYVPEDGPAKCLLAQHNRLPAYMLSTLAGFVDPGESLEEAVIREVFEEAGVKAYQARYMYSQPWPFPSSLMIGFFARADDMTLNIDKNEISDAHWFTAEEVRSFGTWFTESEGYQVPPTESIARALIKEWLKEQGVA